jgi:hypothetical protein
MIYRIGKLSTEYKTKWNKDVKRNGRTETELVKEDE